MKIIMKTPNKNYFDGFFFRERKEEEKKRTEEVEL